MKNKKGITLIALIITIIVMIILVAVTVNSIISSGLINKTKMARTEYEKEAIYEKILGYIVYTKDYEIDTPGTFKNIRSNLLKENKETTLISPEFEGAIEEEIIFKVKGEYGTYVYKIIGDKILESDEKLEEIVIEETPTTKIWKVDEAEKAITEYLGDGGDVVVPKKLWDEENSKWIEIEKLGKDGNCYPFRAKEPYNEDINLTIPDGIRIMPYSLYGPICKLTLYDVIYIKEEYNNVWAIDKVSKIQEVIIKKNCGEKIEDGSGLISNVSTIKRVIVEDGATVPRGMFSYSKSNIEELELGSNIKIGDYAFNNNERFNSKD